MRSHHQEEPGRIHPDSVHQLRQRHQLPPTRGHLTQLAFLQEVDQLADDHLQTLRPTGQYLHHRLHPLYVSVMIRPPDVDQAVSYTHLRAHETKANLVCRLLLEKKKKQKKKKTKKRKKNEINKERKTKQKQNQ